MLETVADLMRTEIVVGQYSQPISSLLPQLNGKQADQIYIEDAQQNFYGIVPDFVLCKALLHQHDLETPIGQLACCQLLTINTTDSLAAVAPLFRESRYAVIPVLDQNRIVGELRRRDVLTVLITQLTINNSTQVDVDAPQVLLQGPKFWQSGPSRVSETKNGLDWAKNVTFPAP